jgi:hypothetical protein
MGWSIIYQSMCVTFSNNTGFILTQLGDSNCTQSVITGKKDRRYREVIAKDWQTLDYATKQGICVVPLSELPTVIHTNLQQITNGKLEENSGIAYKTRNAYKTYSFIENHLKNAISRYSISAEQLLQKYAPLKVFEIGPDNKYIIKTVQELYILLSQHHRSFVFDLPYALEVKDLVTQEKPMSKEKYYIYNSTSNAVFAKTGRKGKNRYTWDVLNPPYSANNLTLDAETWIQQCFQTTIVTFKSVDDLIQWGLLTRGTEFGNYGVCIGKMYENNKMTPEWHLQDLLAKVSFFE